MDFHLLCLRRVSRGICDGGEGESLLGGVILRVFVFMCMCVSDRDRETYKPQQPASQGSSQSAAPQKIINSRYSFHIHPIA
jgi:hypothetical protein